jgi:hypothetical protein
VSVRRRPATITAASLERDLFSHIQVHTCRSRRGRRRPSSATFPQRSRVQAGARSVFAPGPFAFCCPTPADDEKARGYIASSSRPSPSVQLCKVCVCVCVQLFSSTTTPSHHRQRHTAAAAVSQTRNAKPATPPPLGNNGITSGRRAHLALSSSSASNLILACARPQNIGRNSKYCSPSSANQNTTNPFRSHSPRFHVHIICVRIESRRRRRRRRRHRSN